MKALSEAMTAFRSGVGLKGQLLRGGGGSVAIKLGATLLSIGVGVVLARALGAEGYGDYSFVFALVTVMAIPAQMGLPSLVVRETAKAQVKGDWALIRGLWRWATMIALVISLGLMVVGVLAGSIFAERFAGARMAAFYWGLTLVPLAALGNLRGAALRGLHRVIQGQLPEFVLRPAFLIALVLGTHQSLSSGALSASDAMMLHALASLLAFIIGAYLLLRARPAPLRQERIAKTAPRPWLASALPLGMVSGIYALKENVGLLLLGLFSQSTEVGAFRVAVQGAALIAFALTAANMVIAPHIARLHVECRTQDLQRLLTGATRAIVALALPLAIIFFAFGRPLLELLFGSEFTVAYPALLVLTSGQLVNAATGPVGTALAMTGEERCVMSGNFAALLLNIILLFAFVPTFGTVGAAASSSLSTIFLNIFLTHQAKRRIGIRFSFGVGMIRLSLKRFS
jgi:O-antigen/teichoic acid export membrane protein